MSKKPTVLMILDGYAECIFESCNERKNHVK